MPLHVPRSTFCGVGCSASLTAVALAGSVYRVPIQVSDSLRSDSSASSRCPRRPPRSSRVSTTPRPCSGRSRRCARSCWSRRARRSAAATISSFAAITRWPAPFSSASLSGYAARARGPMSPRWPSALVVLTGMHTFVGLFREAFPVNHFLIVAICTLATVRRRADARRMARRSRRRDVLLAARRALVRVRPARVAGCRRRVCVGSARHLQDAASSLMTVVVVLVYAGLRVGYSSRQTSAGVGERGHGVWRRRADSTKSRSNASAQSPCRPLRLQRRDGRLVCAALAADKSGRFTAINAWNNGSLAASVHRCRLPPRCSPSLLIAWYMLSRRTSRIAVAGESRFRWRSSATLAVSALMSVLPMRRTRSSAPLACSTR